MIRRKLTRIEVTLDDTKELDDLLSKSTFPQLATTQQTIQSASESNLSSVKNLLFEKLLNNKRASEVPASSSTTVPAGTTDSTAPVSSAAAVGEQDSTANSLTTSYNPNPYNPSTRFQLNNRD
jgi:hypothetical protein